MGTLWFISVVFSPLLSSYYSHILLIKHSGLKYKTLTQIILLEYRGDKAEAMVWPEPVHKESSMSCLKVLWKEQSSREIQSDFRTAIFL